MKLNTILFFFLQTLERLRLDLKMEAKASQKRQDQITTLQRSLGECAHVFLVKMENSLIFSQLCQTPNPSN